MRTLEQLYELIGTLSAAEIDYFRLYSVSRSEARSADQATLFEALLDEARKSSGHINRIQVDAEVAAGLNEELRKSLRFLYDERTVQSQIRAKISESELLADKCLFVQADAVLAEARKLAIHFERFYEQLEIINRQKAGLQRLNSAEEAAEQRQALEESEQEVLRRLTNYIAYRNLAKEISEAYRHSGSGEGISRLELLQQLFEQPLLSDPQRALSHTARYYFFHLHSTFHYYTGDLLRAWDCSSRLLELIRERPFLVDLSTEAYMVTYFNHLGLALELGEFDLFERRLEEFRQMPGSLLPVESQRFLQAVCERSAFLELKYFLCRGLFAEGVERSELIASKLRNGLLKPDSYFEAQLYYFFAYFYYIAEKNDASILWLERVLDVPEFREEVRMNALVLRLIIAFEGGEHRYFDQELPAALFFIDSMRQGFQADRALLHTLDQAHRERDPDRERLLFFQLRDQLQMVRQNPFEKNPVSSFDALAWLDSRLAGVPFRQVFSRRDSAEKFRVMR